MEPLYYCEKCGKPVYEKFGSGRFCSRACANSRNITDDVKVKISNGLARKEYCECKYCGKEFNTLHSKASHENLCKNNPDRNKYIDSHKKDKSNNYVRMRNGDIINITYRELEEYEKTHQTCEICGRTLTECIKPNSKFNPKQFCTDHNHQTLEFRGLLCSVCNRQLGWYEKNKEKIEKYLSK